MALVVYFDEVGNPTLDASDRDFPVFALSLFICEEEQYINSIIPAVYRLKFRFFGHEGIVLHSRDIRKAQNEFGFLTDLQKKADFYNALNDVMENGDYKLLCVAIRKDRHVAKYVYPADPYDLALTFALERLVSVLNEVRQESVTVIAEKRGKEEDRGLHLSFRRTVTAGTQYVSGSLFRRIRFRLRFLPKSMNIVGTQLADLVAYPFARFVLDPSKANPAYEIVKRKLCRPLKIFP